MVGVAVVCAETDDQARWLHGSARLSFLRLRTGRPSTLPSPEEAAAYEYSQDERVFIDSWTASHVVGSPETVRAGLTDLQETHAGGRADPDDERVRPRRPAPLL